MKRIQGFTLMEIVAAIAIVGILIGILMPVGNVILARQSVRRTQALVQGISSAISTYGVTHWEVATVVGGTYVRRTYPWLWDLNGSTGDIGDGIIDGYVAAAMPDTPDGPFDAALIASGYRGFATMAMPTLIGGRFIDGKGRPIDSWKQPIRISWDGGKAGPQRYRVWSTGPDRADDRGSGDDITDERSP